MAEAGNLFYPSARHNHTKRWLAQQIRETDTLQGTDEMPSQSLLVQETRHEKNRGRKKRHSQRVQNHVSQDSNWRSVMESIEAFSL